MTKGRRRRAELVRARMLSPSVRSLVFRFTDDAPFQFVAGQYVDVLAPTASGMVFKRPYSIASPPDVDALARPPEIEIAVTRVEGGPLSTALHAMPLGAPVEIEGPSGVFTRRDAPGDPLLFVATGTGLAPIRAMLAEELASARAHASAGKSARPITLLFGCRTQYDLLWGDELAAWARAQRITLAVAFSRARPIAIADARPRDGHVQAHLDELAPRAPNAHAYVCGLSHMVDDVVAQLERHGWPRNRLHYEIYD